MRGLDHKQALSPQHFLPETQIKDTKGFHQCYSMWVLIPSLCLCLHPDPLNQDEGGQLHYPNISGTGPLLMTKGNLKSHLSDLGT